MSKSDKADSADGSGGRKVPTEDEYEDDAYDTRWVELEDGDGYFEVREMPPMRILRDMERYNVKALMAGDRSGVEADEMVKDGDLSGFMDNTVLPNIIQPNCYWTVEVDDGPNEQIGEGNFDLTTLSPKDLVIVIKGMLSVDGNELEEMADAPGDSFLGE